MSLWTHKCESTFLTKKKGKQIYRCRHLKRLAVICRANINEVKDTHTTSTHPRIKAKMRQLTDRYQLNLPFCMRSLVNQIPRPSPLKFFFPWPWILNWTLSSQSRRSKGCKATVMKAFRIRTSRLDPEGILGNNNRASYSCYVQGAICSMHVGRTYNSTPHGSLSALQVWGQPDMVRSHHGSAHQIPLRWTGETQSCNVTNTPVSSRIRVQTDGTSREKKYGFESCPLT